MNNLSKYHSTVPKYQNFCPSFSKPQLLCNHLQILKANGDKKKGSNSFVSQCFSAAGIASILGVKTEDEETKFGEGKIIEMIKMSKLCHSVIDFYFHY